LPSCDAALKANFGEDGYYRTQYDAASLVPLTAHFAEFGAADRANLLGDQFAMFQANRAPLSAYLDMLPALKGETNIAVWEDTLSHLNAPGWRWLRGTPVRAATSAPIHAPCCGRSSTGWAGMRSPANPSSIPRCAPT
jgi:hypothetical protein